MELQTEVTRESTHVEVRFERGVLVATVKIDSLLDPLTIREIEEDILSELPRADCAVLVDCSHLIRPVSSQFLSTLVRIHNQAEEAKLPMAICSVSSALRAAYDVTTLTSIIPLYENQPDAIEELGKLDSAHARTTDMVPDFIAQNPDASSQEAPMAATDQLASPSGPPLVEVRLDRGVLVATVVSRSLIHERPICHVEDRILEQLASAESAVLIDCSQLTHQVSSQFLSMLMRVYYQAKEMSLKMGVCGLSEPLREAYRVTALASIVPSYEDYQRAIGELRESPVLGGNDDDAGADADMRSSLRASDRGSPSWWANCDGRSAILLVLCAVVLVGLGFLAGASLSGLGFHITGGP